MKRTLFVTTLSMICSACSLMPDSQQVKRPDVSGSQSLRNSVGFQQQFRPIMGSTSLQHHQKNQSEKDINFYVRALMQDLVSNLQYVNNTTPVAVGSFTLLDSDYTKTNILGNQLAESAMHEMHKLGIPVIDFKTTGAIRVTGQGDFIFSRDYTELSGDMPIRYVMGGTMVKQQNGYLVNARIVGIESKAVVGTGQILLPKQICENILMSPQQKPAATIALN